MQEIDRAFLEPNFLTWFGLRLLGHRPGSAQVELAVRPEFIQTAGAVHGGVVATLADCALACAILSELEPGVTCSTVEFKVNYLEPVRDGSLRAESKVVRRGAHLAVSSADIMDLDGTVVATAVGTFLVRPLDQR